MDHAFGGKHPELNSSRITTSRPTFEQRLVAEIKIDPSSLTPLPNSHIPGGVKQVRFLDKDKVIRAYPDLGWNDEAAIAREINNDRLTARILKVPGGMARNDDCFGGRDIVDVCERLIPLETAFNDLHAYTMAQRKPAEEKLALVARFKALVDAHPMDKSGIEAKYRNLGLALRHDDGRPMIFVVYFDLGGTRSDWIQANQLRISNGQNGIPIEEVAPLLPCVLDLEDKPLTVPERR